MRAEERVQIILILSTLKKEINSIDPFHYIGSGSGCASEMKSDILSIINKYLQILERGTGTPFDFVNKIRPKGEWLYNGDNGSYECSKCRYLVFYSLDKTNFCPDCGADLRDEEERGSDEG